MWIGVISLFPEMFEAQTQYGVFGRAVRDSLLQLAYFNPRDYTHDAYRRVDDRPYGGGPGMVMLIEPLRAAIQAAKLSARQQGFEPKVVYLSPQGRVFQQEHAREMAQRSAFIFLCGRYEGIDERLIELEVDEEWSIGDYVLSGGELAAMVMMDAIARLLPGVLGSEVSAQEDSFSDGLLDCPHYTRPEIYEGKSVPAVLMSGDHAAIKRWRQQQSVLRTQQRRPDLLKKL